MQNQEKDIAILIDGCKANNRKAQELMYRQFYGFAMQVSMRYARDEHDAADIISHAFVKIFKGIRTYDVTKGSLHAWIKRIVVNEAIDLIQARAKFNNHEELEKVTEQPVDNSLVEKHSAVELLQLIRQLPPATQAVFNLYAIEGYNHREIAEMTGISEGTSKWHLSEARKQLQKQLMTSNG